MIMVIIVMMIITIITCLAGLRRGVGGRLQDPGDALVEDAARVHGHHRDRPADLQ